MKTNAKRTAFIIGMFAIVANFAISANAGEKADWYFSNATDNWVLAESCQFQTTDEDDVFVLPSFNLSGNVNYTITNAAWSEYYGWTDGGSVTEAGVAYPLGAQATNGWCGLPAATYDITFDRNAKTIKFDLSENQGEINEGNVWYLTGTFNNWALDDNVKFVQDESDQSVFVLDNIEIPESAYTDGYWNFEIVTSGWSIQYVSAEDVALTGTAYEFVKRAESETAWSSLATGKYKFIWNTGSHTLSIEKANTSGISDIVSDIEEAEAEYYTISGVKVALKDLSKGIYIRKCGNKVKKVIL